MGVKWLLVEFSRELDKAEAPVDCPKPWDLGVESVESARTFSKLYPRTEIRRRMEWK